MSKVIDEIREITASVVVKKQDNAKLNYPKIIERIKNSAKLGESECRISEFEMNQYDKKLLETDGFIVSLGNRAFVDDYMSRLESKSSVIKEWVIKW